MNSTQALIEELGTTAQRQAKPEDFERAVVFDCCGEALLGVVTTGASPGPLGALIVVGGPQYRAGSHRQFVQVARHLASVGLPTLRFDVRGMGDSHGGARSFETLDDDIGAAIEALTQQAPNVQRVLLFGLCDGASAALMYMASHADHRIAGLCLLNPWVRSAHSHARTQLRHYYLDRLKQPDFWRKLLTGRLGFGAASELIRTVRQASARRRPTSAALSAMPFQDRMLAGWQRFDGPVMLGLSADDYTAREFEQFCESRRAWLALMSRANTLRIDFAGADHTFSRPGNMKELLRCCEQWSAAIRSGLR